MLENEAETTKHCLLDITVTQNQTSVTKQLEIFMQ